MHQKPSFLRVESFSSSNREYRIYLCNVWSNETQKNLKREKTSKYAKYGCKNWHIKEFENLLNSISFLFSPFSIKEIPFSITCIHSYLSLMKISSKYDCNKPVEISWLDLTFFQLIREITMYYVMIFCFDEISSLKKVGNTIAQDILQSNTKKLPGPMFKHQWYE